MILQELKNLLISRYANTKIVYIPNTGHLGDSLIAYATIKLLDELKLDYGIGSPYAQYNKQNIIYGGGGNLVGIYKKCENFLIKNKDQNNILLLPHTIRNVDDIIVELGDNVTIICREQISYDYVKSLITFPDNVFIHHDMAIGMDYSEFKKDYHNNFHLNSFRFGPEKTSIHIPDDNIDFSGSCCFPSCTLDKANITKATHIMLNFLSMFNTISTNRLHVAIAGTKMGKNVKFYPNSYYKNKAVYEYSLSNYPNIEFYND